MIFFLKCIDFTYGNCETISGIIKTSFFQQSLLNINTIFILFFLIQLLFMFKSFEENFITYQNKKNDET
jgi:hypothetical protein